MAAVRLFLQRRFGSVLGLNRTGFSRPLFATGAELVFSCGIRLTSTKAESAIPETELQDNPKSPETEEPKVTYKAFSNLKMSARHDMAMVFTCKVCDTRSMKTASRESYEKGIVVARCSGCNNLHLIADRLGWFGEAGSVEDFLALRGEEVKKGSVDTLNFTVEDFTGTGKSS